MLTRPEIQPSAMTVVEYLVGDSSFEEFATKSKVDVHDMKKSRGVDHSNNSTIKQKNMKRNRQLTVTFSLKNDVFEIARRTSEEKSDMHMSPEDQRLIIREISNAVRRVKCDDQFIADFGLNRIIEQQDPERLLRVRSAILAVLQRQRQSRLFPSSKKGMQTINEVWLEKYYRPFSKVSANLARSRGLEDQEFFPFFTPRKIVMSR